MEHKIGHAPTFTTLEFLMGEGESVVVQPGCMLAMTTGFEVTAGMGSHMTGRAGLGRATRSMLAGESFFTANYTSKRAGERLLVAPNDMGEIRSLDVKGEHNHFLASGAFLACTSGVQLSLEYAGVRGFMATRGFFLMRTTGEGLVFVSSYGAIIEQNLAEGERLVLDNRYIIAFSDTMKYELVKVTKSIKHSYFSGEGLVNRFTGPGHLLYQTRPRPSRGFFQGILQMAT